MIDIFSSFDSSTLDSWLKGLEQQINAKIKPLEKEIATDILEEAKKSCPVDSGALKNSGYIKETNAGYEVGFSEPYALVVHEQPQSYRENGERHFLSNAVEKVVGKDGKKIKGLIHE